MSRTRSDSSTSLYTLIMIFLALMFAIVATARAQGRPIESRGAPEWNMGRQINPSSNSKSTVIENKNVNIIVNVDPKDVAKELFKLIQGRMDGRQNRRSNTPDDRKTVNDLEKIIIPIVKPTRRSNRPTALEVAHALDRVTRNALTSDHPTRPTIDDEIATRDVVARMMTKLKNLTEIDDRKSEPTNRESSPMFRRMEISDDDRSDENDAKSREDDRDVVDDNDNDDDVDDDDRFINFHLKIRKSELVRKIGTGLGTRGSN